MNQNSTSIKILTWIAATGCFLMSMACLFPIVNNLQYMSKGLVFFEHVELIVLFVLLIGLGVCVITRNLKAVLVASCLITAFMIVVNVYSLVVCQNNFPTASDAHRDRFVGIIVNALPWLAFSLILFLAIRKVTAVKYIWFVPAVLSVVKVVTELIMQGDGSRFPSYTEDKATLVVEFVLWVVFFILEGIWIRSHFSQKISENDEIPHSVSKKRPLSDPIE